MLLLRCFSFLLSYSCDFGRVFLCAPRCTEADLNEIYRRRLIKCHFCFARTPFPLAPPRATIGGLVITTENSVRGCGCVFRRYFITTIAPLEASERVTNNAQRSPASSTHTKTTSTRATSAIYVLFCAILNCSVPVYSVLYCTLYYGTSTKPNKTGVHI